MKDILSIEGFIRSFEVDGVLENFDQDEAADWLYEKLKAFELSVLNSTRHEA